MLERANQGTYKTTNKSPYWNQPNLRMKDWCGFLDKENSLQDNLNDNYRTLYKCSPPFLLLFFFRRTIAIIKATTMQIAIVNTTLNNIRGTQAAKPLRESVTSVPFKSKLLTYILLFGSECHAMSSTYGLQQRM